VAAVVNPKPDAESEDQPQDLTVPVYQNRWVCPFCERIIPIRLSSMITKPPNWAELLNDIIRCGMCGKHFSPRGGLIVEVAGPIQPSALPPIPEPLICPWDEVPIPRQKITPAIIPRKYASVLHPVFRCGMEGCGRSFSPRRAPVEVVLRQ
jgi:hypothetical protein